MFYVYVLRSAKNEGLNIGYSTNLRKRVARPRERSFYAGDVSTTMIYTHVLNKPGLAVRSPLDQAIPAAKRYPIIELDETFSSNSR